MCETNILLASLCEKRIVDIDCVVTTLYRLAEGWMANIEILACVNLWCAGSQLR